MFGISTKGLINQKSPPKKITTGTRVQIYKYKNWVAMGCMNTILNYIHPVFNYLFRQKQYVSLEPPAPSSPRSLEFCYDCGNYLCVNTTKDVSNWTLLQKKKRKIYFCKNSCLEEWLEEFSNNDTIFYKKQ